MKNPDSQILSEVRAAIFYHELESDNLETMVLNKKTSTVSVCLVLLLENRKNAITSL